MTVGKPGKTSKTDMRRIVVLISGSGTNLQALIDATKEQRLSDVEIVLVISNKIKAFGLLRAKDAGIATKYHNLLQYKRKYQDINEARHAYDSDLAQIIIEAKPELVVCAGWMHILSSAALRPLRKVNIGIINLHPALPGMFDGAQAIERQWEAFQSGEIDHGGLMIHWVIEQVDRGEPLVVKTIDMKNYKSIEQYEQEVHDQEHIAIVEGTIKALNKNL